MANVRQYNEIMGSLPAGVALVAISKNKTTDEILEVYAENQRLFGENKVQELVPKYEALPKDISWHFVGHLQSNKVKYIAPFIDLIHSVDSLKLIQTINKEAQKNNRIIPILLQIYIADEQTKFGLDYNEALEILQSGILKTFTHIEIHGLMGMATFTDDLRKVREEFKGLSNFFRKVKKDFFFDSDKFKILSMGMTDDYHIAIEEGSNLVRIGSAVFGSRLH